MTSEPDAHRNTTAASRAFDAELIAMNDALLRDLSTVLDVDQGLADARLPGRHTTLTEEIAGLLDLGGGLTAILPAAFSPSPPRAEPDHRSLTPPPLAAHRLGSEPTFASLALLANRLRKTAPGFRLRLRGDVRGDAVANAVALLLACSAAFDRALHEQGENTDAEVAAPVAALDRDLRRIQQRLRRLLDTLQPEVRAATDQQFAGTLRVRDDRSDAASASVAALARARAYVRDLARTLVFKLGLGAGQPFMAAIDRDIERLAQLDAPLDMLLAADLTAIRKARDDFTTADLTDVGLAGLDLYGVRWTRRGTRWPTDWLDWIEENSSAVEDEPGVRVIRAGRRYADSELAFV